MKNDTMSRALTAILALELEYRQGDGIGFEPSMLMLENENRSRLMSLPVLRTRFGHRRSEE